MVNSAIILAAGLGSRIQKHAGQKPKGFLMLAEKPIIEHSIANLLEMGFEKIYLGTGYRAEEYEKLALRYPQLVCIPNPEYAQTGSLWTLYQFKEHIHEDFLLLESDLIYEKAALKVLKDMDKPDVILASKFTSSGDEVFIETDENQLLLNMSKSRDSLNEIYGELVGITKLSFQSFQKICSEIEGDPRYWKCRDYEDGIIKVSKDVKVYVHKHDIVWCEVDDEHHWTRANQYIYPLIQSRQKAKPPVHRNILLNPGPATTSDSVKYAQIVPDICPREGEFGEIMTFISEELTKMAGSPDTCTTVLFGGSGTAAVESILSSCIDTDPVIIINNGAYGKRMCQMAEAYRLEYIEYKSEEAVPLDLQKLEDTIRNLKRKPSHLAIVHNETTTGMLNDIEAVGRLCAKYKMEMIVDAMSSFAAIPINMEQMNISYLAASSNKNLQGMAGVSFVIANLTPLQKTKNIPPRNLYLQLYDQFDHFKRTKQMRFTPPVQTLYALKQAILETKWEGIEQRYERYAKSWETLVNGLTRLGLKYLVPESAHSKIITSVAEPENEHYDFEEMHEFFYKRGFTIYPGKLDDRKTFRIANIGDITSKDMEEFIVHLEQYLKDLERR